MSTWRWTRRWPSCAAAILPSNALLLPFVTDAGHRSTAIERLDDDFLTARFRRWHSDA